MIILINSSEHFSLKLIFSVEFSASNDSDFTILGCKCGEIMYNNSLILASLFSQLFRLSVAQASSALTTAEGSSSLGFINSSFFNICSVNLQFYKSLTLHNVV